MKKTIEIIYEDKWLVAIDKPSGLMSVAGNRKDVETAYMLVNDYLMHKYNGRVKAHVLHRLDRDTSGVLLFAKDFGVKRAMTEGWNEQVLERKYVAVVDGVPETGESGRIVSWLTQDDSNFMVRSSLRDNGGEMAVTNWRVLKTDGKRSLVEFLLETGRKNQIRVQAATHLHCPVLGDPKYGDGKSARRLCLHAKGLSVVHPVTHKMLKITANTPRYFNGLVRSNSIRTEHDADEGRTPEQEISPNFSRQGGSKSAAGRKNAPVKHTKTADKRGK